MVKPKEDNICDYSIKPLKICKSRVFPSVKNLYGFSYFQYSLVKYSVENIEKVVRRESYKSITNHDDEYSKEKCFLFAEGFNSVGLETREKNESLRVDGSTSALLQNLALASFPCSVVFELGKILANNENNIAKQVKDFQDKHDNNATVKYYRSWGLEDYGVYNTYGLSSIRNKNIFSPENIIEAYRLSTTERNFEKLMPLIEKFAQEYTDKRLSTSALSHEVIFPLFYSINEFLEHGKDDETLHEFLSTEKNMKEISRQYNSCELNEYKHTGTIINNFILPDRVFSSSIIKKSSYRRALLSQKKSAISLLVNFNLPFDVRGSESLTFKKIFKTINLIVGYDLKRNREYNNLLVSASFINSRKYHSKKELGEIEEFIYYKEEDKRPRAKELLGQIRNLNSSEFEIFKRIVDGVRNAGVNLKLEHVAIMSYIVASPKSIGSSTGAEVLATMDYILEKSHLNVDFVCDVFLILVTNEDFNEIDIKSWGEIIDFHEEYGSKISAKNIIRIVSQEKVRSVDQPLHKNSRLKKIIDEYVEYRPSALW